jgi:hypothetical protein
VAHGLCAGTIKSAHVERCLFVIRLAIVQLAFRFV